MLTSSGLAVSGNPASAVSMIPCTSSVDRLFSSPIASSTIPDTSSVDRLFISARALVIAVLTSSADIFSKPSKAVVIAVLTSSGLAPTGSASTASFTSVTALSIAATSSPRSPRAVIMSFLTRFKASCISSDTPTSPVKLSRMFMIELYRAVGRFFSALPARSVSMY